MEVDPLVEVTKPCPYCDGQLEIVGVAPNDYIVCSDCGEDYGAVQLYEM